MPSRQSSTYELPRPCCVSQHQGGFDGIAHSFAGKMVIVEDGAGNLHIVHVQFVQLLEKKETVKDYKDIERGWEEG